MYSCTQRCPLSLPPSIPSNSDNHLPQRLFSPIPTKAFSSCLSSSSSSSQLCWLRASCQNKTRSFATSAAAAEVGDKRGTTDTFFAEESVSWTSLGVSDRLSRALNNVGLGRPSLVQEISLQGNSIGDEGVHALMSSLSLREGRLQHLDIGNNAITSEGAVHVAEYVRESKSLVFLNLSMNDIGDEGAKEIAESLKQNQSLANLDLGGNNIHAQGASAIAQGLKENFIITKLEISYNPIGPHGAKALFEVLKSHGNIKTLSLGWCQIGAMGVEFIADALKSNSTISTLDLRANGLGDEGAVCLAQSLKVVNGALTSLDLGFNEIRDDGAFAIARALKANENVSLTKLNLSSNSISKLGQGVLTDAVDHVYEMTEKEVNIFF